MADEEKKPGVADGKKKKPHYNGRFARGTTTGRSTYKSKVQGLENDTFDVGASSDPAKFSKSLKNIENYIQKTYKDPDDMVKTIQQLKKVSLSFPARPKKTDNECCDENGDPDPDAFEMAVFAWKEDYKSMKLRMDKYKGNESNAWALIYDQCSPELKNKLEGTENYDAAKSTNDVAKLLTMIRGYCCQFDLLSDEYMAIVAAIKNLFYFFQKVEQSNADYHEDFMAMLEVIEEYGGAGSMTHFPNMLKREIEADGTDMSNATNEQMKKGKKVVREKFLAALMLSGANGTKYNDLKRGMKENFVTGTSTYPESPEAVLRILNAYVPPAGWNKRRQEAGTTSEEGAMFAQTGDGGDNWKAKQTCYKCGEKGHIARECPEKEKRDHMHTTIEEEAATEEEDIDDGENIFVQQKEVGVVNRNWVLLDSQSTIDQISNPAMLTNIRKAKIPSKIHCNAGSTCSVLEGDFGNITVKHSPYGIANVLSLNGAKQRHRVTYDSEDRGGVFQVHTDEGIVEFKPSARGLHYHDVSDASSNIEVMLVNTVRENFEGYSRHEVKKAKEARRIQGMIANPTEKEFAGMGKDD